MTHEQEWSGEPRLAQQRIEFPDELFKGDRARPLKRRAIRARWRLTAISIEPAAAPAQPCAIIAANGAKLGETRLDKRPTDRGCRDSRLKHHDRLPGALPVEMEAARADIDHAARRRKPPGIEPAPERLVNHSDDRQNGKNEQQQQWNHDCEASSFSISQSTRMAGST